MSRNVSLLFVPLLLLVAVAMTLQANTYSYVVQPGEAGVVEACLTTLDGKPVANAPLTFGVNAPGLGSGYHPHDTGAGRPNITLFNPSARTGGNGCGSVDVSVPPFAGYYTISASAPICVNGVPTGQGTVNAQISLTAQQNILTVFIPSSGIAGLSTHFDPLHGGWQWYGTPHSNTQIVSIGYQWYTAPVVRGSYPPLRLDRMALPWGGYLDNGVFNGGVWNVFSTDPHPYGQSVDIDNPSLTDPNKQQVAVLIIERTCGTPPIAIPTYMSLAAASEWHVLCP